MMYFSADLIRHMDTGEVDELGNKVVGDVVETISNCRATQWTSEDVSVYGREVTTSSRKVLIRPTVGSIKHIEKIRIDTKTYDVIDRQNLGRWILLIVRGYRI